MIKVHIWLPRNSKETGHVSLEVVGNGVVVEPVILRSQKKGEIYYNEADPGGRPVCNYGNYMSLWPSDAAKEKFYPYSPGSWRPATQGACSAICVDSLENDKRLEDGRDPDKTIEFNSFSELTHRRISQFILRAAKDANEERLKWVVVGDHKTRTVASCYFHSCVSIIKSFLWQELWPLNDGEDFEGEHAVVFGWEMGSTMTPGSLLTILEKCKKNEDSGNIWTLEKRNKKLQDRIDGYKAESSRCCVM